MGRHLKKVLSDKHVDRRETGYYSTPDFVAQFIADRLIELRPDARTVFDPCIGRGELTTPFKARNLRVTGFDITDMSPAGCDCFYHRDFLKFAHDYRPLSLFSSTTLETDLIVANPPYNCHEVNYIRSHKGTLIERFGKSAALNMYSLFVRAIIELAPTGCIIGLITHDSFLTARGHAQLRQLILDTCTIHNLHLCPTDLFLEQGADVRTCLLIIEKGHKPGIYAQVSNRPRSTSEFKQVLFRAQFDFCKTNDLTLTGKRDNSEFIIGVPDDIRELFTTRRLSDVAPCITGISTGDDNKYLRPETSSLFAIPFYKNPGTRQFFTTPDAYLCTDYENVERRVSTFMVRNKGLILRGGITCSSMGVHFGGAIRPEGTACGVNPNIIVTDESKWWMLSYLNSRLCLFLARAVILRTNMITPGYAARIPLPVFDQRTVATLTGLGREAYDAAKAGRTTGPVKVAINNAVEAVLGLSPKTRLLLMQFEQDPIRLT